MEKESKYIDELDYILHFLATSPYAKGNITDGGILEHLDTSKNITAGRLIKILNKLSNDNFVEVEEIKPHLGSMVLSYGISTYKISFNGLVQDEIGGYKAIYLENNKLKNIQKWQFRLTLYIGLGAIIASIYYILEIWKFFTQCN